MRSESEEDGEHRKGKCVHSIRPHQSPQDDRRCHRCLLLTGRIHISVRWQRGAVQPEPAARHAASVVSGQARPADVRPHGIHGARRGDAHLADQRRAPIAVTAHAALVVIDEPARDTIQDSVILQREPRPLPRERAARSTCPTDGFPLVRHVRCTEGDHRDRASARVRRCWPMDRARVLCQGPLCVASVPR